MASSGPISFASKIMYGIFRIKPKFLNMLFKSLTVWSQLSFLMIPLARYGLYVCSLLLLNSDPSA